MFKSSFACSEVKEVKEVNLEVKELKKLISEVKKLRS